MRRKSPAALAGSLASRDAMMGLQAANLFRVKDESGCKPSVSLRDSCSPDTQGRVLFVSGPAACMLATASVAV
eukprot:2230726-Rhodomonas_salina.1